MARPTRGQKRVRHNNDTNNDEKRKHGIKEDEEPFTGPLKSEDYFSLLSDDCLLAVLGHLPRASIRNVMTVNKRVYPVTKHRSLERSKWRGGDLVIHDTNRGYGFVISYPWSKKSRPQAKTSCEYEVFKSIDGTIIGREKIKIGGVIGDHSWPIPALFFTALGKVLRFHGARSIRIENLRFDDFPFDLLESALGGCVPETLVCARMTSERLSDETRDSFFRLIKNIKHVDLTKSSCMPSLINQDSIRELGNSTVSGKVLLCPEIPSTALQVHLFQADKSIDKLLLNFRHIDAYAMIVDSGSIVQLIITCMNRINDGSYQGRWQFLTIQPPTLQMMKDQIKKANFEYSAPHMYTNMHRLVKELDPKTEVRADFKFTKVERFVQLHTFLVDFYTHTSN